MNFSIVSAYDPFHVCHSTVTNLDVVSGQCLTPVIVYEATVTNDIPRYEPRRYKGMTERIFKERRKHSEIAGTKTIASCPKKYGG